MHKKYALRMLGEDKNPADLEPGDILLGFHHEPVSVVVESPEDGKDLYPDNEHAARNCYVRLRSVDPLNITPETDGISVFNKDSTVRVGTVPLKRVPGKMFWWEKPDGSRVEMY